MKIKQRNDILRDIIRDGKKQPKGWHASFGTDPSLFSRDCYIFHPHIGVYLLKEYNKNPFETKGVGLKLARHIDEDIQEQLTRRTGDFGIIQGDIQKILANLNKGISPQRILTSALQGADLGVTIPIQGRASTSPDTFHLLKNSFSQKQKKLEYHLEKMVSEDGLYTSYE